MSRSGCAITASITHNLNILCLADLTANSDAYRVVGLNTDFVDVGIADGIVDGEGLAAIVKGLAAIGRIGHESIGIGGTGNLDRVS